MHSFLKFLLKLIISFVIATLLIFVGAMIVGFLLMGVKIALALILAFFIFAIIYCILSMLF